MILYISDELNEILKPETLKTVKKREWCLNKHLL